ncbi:MAG: Hsp70 family protein [Clostridium sp.]|uniref:Hsp70 family protein n=1 Tax=Clostridium sp. TaxID=1506 RepID=UPI003D6D2C70
MKRGTFIGIDFGTTNTSVVCVISDEHGTKTMYLGEAGEYPFSSIVAIPKNEGNMLFGRDVKRRRLELSDNYTIITSMKSWLGTDKEFIVDHKRYSPIKITTAFFSHVKNYIKEHYNISIKDATLAFPVDFTPEARTALKLAAMAAGINVKGFISESTAAYIANKNDAKAYSKVMVVDWGGGTLDICILDLNGTRIYENSVYGDKIGGDDIDIELAHRIHSKLVSQTGIKLNYDDMTLAEKDIIISQCESAKIEFSDYDDADILLRNYGKFGTKTVSLDYDYFEDVVSPIIKNKVLKTINIAMERSKTSKAGIDAVIIVGGSCGLRPFANAMTNIFGNDKIIVPEKVQWSVAIGAAFIDIIGSEYYLNDDVGVLLSDNTIYPIFKKHRDKIGSVIAPITFSLTEDTFDAHFIFTNGDNSINYGSTDVYTKGFLKESLQLSASIDNDQIAKIKITNSYMGNEYIEKIEINKLKFYYDLSEIKDI